MTKQTRQDEELDHSKCGFSTGLAEEITAGQGKLDPNGYWEIPCDRCALIANQNWRKNNYA